MRGARSRGNGARGQPFSPHNAAEAAHNSASKPPKKHGDLPMKIPSILAAACAVSALPMFAGSAASAPLAPNLALTNADTVVVQEVQYRRGWRGGWRSGRWIGPGAGFAAGFQPAGS